ncbi:jg7596, partial [Pararge aegeria aegeria]
EKPKEPSEEGKSEEEAATKIQAVFRGHKTRQSISMKAATKSGQEPEPSKAELEAEFRADDK